VDALAGQLDLAVGHRQDDSVPLDCDRKLSLTSLAKVDELGPAGSRGSAKRQANQE
jgi:hypothetical protein